LWDNSDEHGQRSAGHVAQVAEGEPLPVKAEGDHVDPGGPAPVEGVAGSEGGSQPLEPGLLGPVHRLLGRPGGPAPPGADFDEDQDLTVEGHQVQLAQPVPEVPGEDLVSQSLEIEGGEGLAPPAQLEAAARPV